MPEQDKQIEEIKRLADQRSVSFSIEYQQGGQNWFGRITSNAEEERREFKKKVILSDLLSEMKEVLGGQTDTESPDVDSQELVLKAIEPEPLQRAVRELLHTAKQAGREEMKEEIKGILLDRIGFIARITKDEVKDDKKRKQAIRAITGSSPESYASSVSHFYQRVAQELDSVLSYLNDNRE